MVQKMKKSRAGFTLVELIVVIAILGILAGIAVPVYSGYIAKANEAGDLQLLAAVNTAYSAARAEMGLGAENLMGYAVLTGDTGAKKLTSVSAQLANGQTVDGMNEAFARYYAGNEDKAFKTIEVLRYVPSEGVFVGYTAGETMYVSATIGGKEVSLAIKASDLAAYQDSTFNSIGTENLTSAIDSLADLTTDKIDVWTREGNNPGFTAFLESLGVEDISSLSDDAKANALVLYAAHGAQDVDTEEFYNMVKNGDVTLTGKVDANKIVTRSSALYALMYAYANTKEAASNPIVSGGETGSKMGLASVNKKEYQTWVKKYGAENVVATFDDGTVWNGTTNYSGQKNVTFTVKTSEKSVSEYFEEAAGKLNNMTDVSSMYQMFSLNEGFQSYVASTQGQNDLEGFFSAMNIIDSNISSTNVQDILSNGYTDASLQEALKYILGS